jgi:hypothetical protein
MALEVSGPYKVDNIGAKRLAKREYEMDDEVLMNSSYQKF